MNELERLTAAADWRDLAAYLLANSRLPGPRANLELAAAFARHVGVTGLSDDRYRQLLEWARFQAPPDGPDEYLPCVAVQALGALLLSAGAERRAEIWGELQTAARVERWRVRESVAMACQTMLEADFAGTAARLEQWMATTDLLELRAIVAALAHPPVLGAPEHTRYCLGIADRVLRRLAAAAPAERKRDSYRVLRQAMEYAVSVFVAALPADGFALMRCWAACTDPDIRKVMKVNLTKGRLKRFQTEVAELNGMLA